MPSCPCVYAGCPCPEKLPKGLLDVEVLLMGVVAWSRVLSAALRVCVIY